MEEFGQQQEVQQHEKFVGEQQREPQQEEQQHEQFIGDKQYEQLQDEQQHDLFVGEQQRKHLQDEQRHEGIEWEQQRDRDLEEEEEEEELAKQRQQRRQQLFQLQQQLQQLRELQQLHQHTRSVDTSVTSPHERTGVSETGHTVRIDDRTSQTTKLTTNQDVRREASPTVNVYGNDVDDTQEHQHQRSETKSGEQLKQVPSKEDSGSREERDIGLPLLHRINEALSEAAEILSHSMSPSVFVDEINKEIRSDHALDNATKDGAISTKPRPTRNTNTISLSEVASGMNVSADNGNASVVLPDRPRNLTVDGATCCGDSLIVSPGAGSPVNGPDDRSPRVCGTGTLREEDPLGPTFPSADEYIWDYDIKTRSEYELCARGDTELTKKQQCEDLAADNPDDSCHPGDTAVTQKQLITNAVSIPLLRHCTHTYVECHLQYCGVLTMYVIQLHLLYYYHDTTLCRPILIYVYYRFNHYNFASPVRPSYVIMM